MSRYEIFDLIHSKFPSCWPYVRSNVNKFRDFALKVNIEESSKIRFVKTPPIRSGNEITEDIEENAPQTTVEVDNSKAVIQFKPDRETQKQIAKALKKPEHVGIAGQFVIQYDVDMTEAGGEVCLLIKRGGIFQCRTDYI